MENESLQLSGRGVETFLDPIDYNGRVTTTVRVGPLLRRSEPFPWLLLCLSNLSLIEYAPRRFCLPVFQRLSARHCSSSPPKSIHSTPSSPTVFQTRASRTRPGISTVSTSPRLTTSSHRANANWKKSSTSWIGCSSFVSRIALMSSRANLPEQGEQERARAGDWRSLRKDRAGRV